MMMNVLLLLGIDSLFASVEAVIGAVQDSEWVRSKNIPKYQIVIGVVVFIWIGTLIFCTNGGSYLLYAADIYIPLLSFFIVAFLQCASGCWLYGCDKIFGLLPEDKRFPFPSLWKITWCAICPLIILCLLIIAFWNEINRPTLDLPMWAFILGWIFALLPSCTILWFALFPSGIPDKSILNIFGKKEQVIEDEITKSESKTEIDLEKEI